MDQPVERSCHSRRTQIPAEEQQPEVSFVTSATETPTWQDVSAILMRLGSCMKGQTGLDFEDEKMVLSSWDIIMDAAIPRDGRRQIVKPMTDRPGGYWLLRNAPSSMPPNPKMSSYPDYGQFTDAELTTLNLWGESQGKTSYRAAIHTLAPVPPGGLKPLGQHNSNFIRYDVDAVYKNPLLKSQILDAFRILKDPTQFPRVYPNNATKDLGEWGDLVAIHGGPWQVYKEKDGLGMWCWHRVIQFLPWHRPWIASMEGALVAAQIKLGYPNPIGLPYWNPVIPYKNLDGKPAWKNGHPMFFDDTYISLVDNKEHKNPLNPKYAESLFAEDGTVLGTEEAKKGGDNRTSRRILRGWPNIQKNNVDGIKVPPGKHLADPDVWNDDWYFDFSESLWPQGSDGLPLSDAKPLKDWMNDILGLAPLQNSFYVHTSQWGPGKSPAGWAQCIETVHNQIHNWIGVDCQDATIAGWDPILYFFHCHIDNELQAVIDHYGSNFFLWFNQTPDGVPDPNDMTFLHMPVPFPPELHNLLRKRLGKWDLPIYKQCFQLNWFNYEFDKPYQFPNVTQQSFLAVKVKHGPMESTTIEVVNGAEKIAGAAKTLGMSMKAGPMRSFSPDWVFLDIILFDASKNNPAELHLKTHHDGPNHPNLWVDLASVCSYVFKP